MNVDENGGRRMGGSCGALFVDVDACHSNLARILDFMRCPITIVRLGIEVGMNKREAKRRRRELRTIVHESEVEVPTHQLIHHRHACPALRVNNE